MNSAVHSRSEPLRGVDGARPAMVGAESKSYAPGTSKRNRRRSGETQKADGVAGRADLRLETIDLVRGQLHSDGQLGSDAHAFAAVAGDDLGPVETQSPTVIATIQELWRRRQAWHRAEKSLTLQAKAICRRYVGGDKDEADKLFATVGGQCPNETQSSGAPVAVAILPLMMAGDDICQHRNAVEKELTKLAKSLPVYSWVAGVKGFGALSLAALVGECGDIGSYKSVSAVWKRMGLAVIAGERQRRVTGPDALLHGYSPQRRAVAWNIGVSLMRAQKPGSAYRDYYNSEKEKQLAKGLTKGHAHNRACRHMTKRLLAELYGQWTAR